MKIEFYCLRSECINALIYLLVYLFSEFEKVTVFLRNDTQNLCISHTIPIQSDAFLIWQCVNRRLIFEQKYLIAAPENICSTFATWQVNKRKKSWLNKMNAWLRFFTRLSFKLRLLSEYFLQGHRFDFWCTSA